MMIITAHGFDSQELQSPQKFKQKLDADAVTNEPPCCKSWKHANYFKEKRNLYKDSKELYDLKLYPKDGEYGRE